MKVLSIGNEQTSSAHLYLNRLVKEARKELLLSNLCYEGASVEDHYRNYIDEEEVYFYETYLPFETEMMRPDGIALHEAVEEEDWDFITLQQNGELSGDEESYKPYLGELSAYCRMMHPGAKIMLVQPWAFEKNCALPCFREFYGKDSENMFEMIKHTCSVTSANEEIDGIIPIGHAFRLLGATSLENTLTKDGVQASELGAFAAGCVLYEAFFGESCLDSPFKLKDVPDEINELIKICAHTAAEEYNK